MKTYQCSYRGFTIIEMLVVIGIITLLLAMLLPALSGVQNRARKNTELSYLRQIHVAWMSYANENNDAALPGYLDEDVQARWRTRIDFPYEPDEADGPGPGPGDPSDSMLPNSATGSSAALGLIAQSGPATPQDVDQTGATWTWRLLHYLDFAFDAVLQYDDEADRTIRRLVERRQFAARHPAFGYNGMYVGGRWHVVDGRPQYFFTNARAIDDSGDEGPRVNVVSRTVSNIQRSSEVIIFCSSMRIPTPRVVKDVLDVDPGYHMVTPPITADEVQWGHTPVGGPGQGDARYVSTFASPALVPIGRYNGMVPILRADGSTSTQSAGALVDQRSWIDLARTSDFRHTQDSNDSNFAEFP
jgi:prepilin-type N-terminal cleavage/methylation domain-containing protein